MSRLILCLLVLLAACTRSAPTPPAAAFRDPAAPIWSNAAFDMGRLQGRWQQVATFAADTAPACAPGGAEFRRTPSGGMTVAARLCLNGRETRVSGPVTPTGPGRFDVPGMGEWWVIWVDVGYRTLAIGTPSGGYGFVLDTGRIGTDRLTAAREIFDFNGYRTTAMRPF